jgi:adapter protein MecA 1/2
MRFEKISNDIIKVNVSTKDLVDNHINSKEVMSNPTESQTLFLAVLEQAEKDIGFITNDYSLRVETIALADGTFTLTITRCKGIDNFDNDDYEYDVLEDKCLIYEFESFDSYVDFTTLIKTNKRTYNNNLIKDSKLYRYQDKYYLELLDINLNSRVLKNFYSTIIEFAALVPTSDCLYKKIYEYGITIFPTKAIKTTQEYFITDK